MSVLDDKVQWISEELQANHGLSAPVVGASDFLEWLKELLMELLPLIVKCFVVADDAVKAINDPNWFQEFRLNRFLRQSMDVKTQRKLFTPLSLSMLKLGKTITKDEYLALTVAA